MQHLSTRPPASPPGPPKTPPPKFSASVSRSKNTTPHFLLLLPRAAARTSILFLHGRRGRSRARKQPGATNCRRRAAALLFSSPLFSPSTPAEPALSRLRRGLEASPVKP